jgi:hypothetical protein
MNQKRKHHFIPASLSRNFCKKDNILYLYDVLEEKIVQASPRDVFLKKDFHTVILKGGEKDHNTMEGLLMDLESKGIPSIRKFIENEPIEDEDRLKIAEFWAIQYLRTPAKRDMVEKMLKQGHESEAILMDKMGKFSPFPESLLKYGNNIPELLDSGIIKFNIPPQMTMTAMKSFEKIAKIIFKMNWCLIESDQNDHFVLPDNPCSFVYDDFRVQDKKMLFMNPGVETALPIGLHHCLIAGWKKMPQKIRGTEKRVKEINKRSAIFTDRFIVSPVKSKKMMGFFMRFAAGRPETDVQAVPAPSHEGEGTYIIIRENIFKSEQMFKHYITCKPIFKNSQVSKKRGK